jgi:hypothetical protein
MVLLNRQHCTITKPDSCYAQVFVDDIEAARSCTLVGFKVSRNEVFWFTRGTPTNAFLQSPRVLGANAYSDPGYMGGPSQR